jgi:hypothetical protein
VRIAIIGWGSLIWNPKRLAIQGRWHRDGPWLPVEFARKSQDGRLTLVLQTPSKLQQTYWATSSLDSLLGSRENLRVREGSGIELDQIHWVTRSETRGPAGKTANEVGEWLATRNDLDAAIWTGLPSTPPFDGPNAIVEAVTYLENLDADVTKRAREYVVKTPPQVQTTVRREMQS